MKQLIIGLFFFTYVIVLQAQNHDHNWLIGKEGSFSTNLNFNSGSLQIDSVVRNMPMDRTATSMSDSLGNLIFYTNGITINDIDNYEFD